MDLRLPGGSSSSSIPRSFPAVVRAQHQSVPLGVRYKVTQLRIPQREVSNSSMRAVNLPHSNKERDAWAITTLIRSELRSPAATMGHFIPTFGMISSTIG